MNLDKHKSNVFSQYGEDGVIKRILEIAEVKTGWCLDIGAWDGIKFSNIRNALTHSKFGLRAVFVEADRKRWERLKDNYSDLSYVQCVNQFVKPIQVNFIVGRYAKMFGIQKIIFNIDIDGEHHLYVDKMKWDWLIVVAEWNNRGDTSELQPLLDIAAREEYVLVCKTNSNLIFVPKDLADKIEEAEKE